MRPFDYVRPESVSEAIAVLGKTHGHQQGAARLLAGGTDLLTLMKHEINTPEQLIDIKRLPELDDSITESEHGITIGALTTLSRLEDDPLIRESCPALSDAAAIAASPQLRNMATIGGNLLQRPRCWYYRSEHVDCWLKGGADCPARDGENQQHAIFDGSPCVAVHPSDLATALFALDAEVYVRGPRGDRSVPFEAFFALPDDERRTETTLATDEIIMSVNVPREPRNTRSTYVKAMDRKVWAFALVGVAARLVIEDGRIADARLVLGGVAPIPWRVADAEALLIGQSAGPELFERVARVAVEGAEPLAKNGYKVPLATSLVSRALSAIAT